MCKRAFSNLAGDSLCNETGIVLSSSLPVPRSTADENSNHNHLTIEENSFTVQLTFRVILCQVAQKIKKCHH